jgi:hypothetical protein
MESVEAGGSGSEIAEWLKTFCNIPADRAVALAQRLDTEAYITTLQELQNMLSSTPAFLDVLEIAKPMQMVITTKLAAYSNKKLEDLSVREVQHLLDQLFPEEMYGLQFRKNKISGFVLKFTDNVQKLVEWGISSPIHAEAIWLSVGKWKASGVPRSQLPPAGGSISSEEVSSASKQHSMKVKIKIFVMDHCIPPELGSLRNSHSTSISVSPTGTSCRFEDGHGEAQER